MKKAMWYLWVMVCGPALAHGESLYDETRFEALYADQVSWKTGDNITVIVVENTVASTRADNSSDRGTNISAEMDAFDVDEEVSASTQSNSSNSGKTERQSRFIAQVSVTIQEVDANDRFYVSGNQEILINDEKQNIHVEGWVRHVDIDAGNRVLSTRLADAKIHYDGYGDVSKSIKPGLFQRFFQAIGIL